MSITEESPAGLGRAVQATLRSRVGDPEPLGGARMADPPAAQARAVLPAPGMAPGTLRAHSFIHFCRALFEGLCPRSWW